MMKCFRIHKTRGTCKIVNVYASEIRFESGGAISFWINEKLVMAYSKWAWKSVYEEPD